MNKHRILTLRVVQFTYEHCINLYSEKIVDVHAFVKNRINNKICILGGFSEPSVIGKCEYFCSKSNTWKEAQNMNYEKSALSTTMISYKNTETLSDFV